MASIHILLVLLLLPSISAKWSPPTLPLNRSAFPPGFLFGTASSALQYEGAAREGGKGPSIWDQFVHDYPEKIVDRSNPYQGADFYHRYKKDVNLMTKMNTDVFRLSIAWSRILPHGSKSKGINQEGIRFYNDLINTLLSKGLKPFVTLVHFDPPQALQDLYGGFLSDKIIEDYKDYVDICFGEFGDRVKYWITFNEPFVSSAFGYGLGTMAPGRCSSCPKGDSGREPYIVAHNHLLAHAAAVKLYKQKYQASQKGVIGLTNLVFWYTPYSKSASDIAATKRAIDFQYGWFMDPLTYGEYPESMRRLVGDRLPRFTEEQSEMLKGSCDFIGVNYYTGYYVQDDPSAHTTAAYATDSRATPTPIRQGKPIGSQAGSVWLFVYPRGIRDVLVYTKKKYNNPLIYITENGISEKSNYSLPLDETLNDNARINYYKKHFYYLHKAIREGGVNVKGYMAWSLLDCWEFGDGFSVRFGIVYVDYKKDLGRYPKKSFFWLRSFFKKG